MVAIQLGMALVAGVALGVFHFGSLWLTLRFLPTTHYAALLVTGSLLVRMGVTLLGFYLVMGSRMERMVVCLLGFVAVRVLLARRLGPRRRAAGREDTDDGGGH